MSTPAQQPRTSMWSLQARVAPYLFVSPFVILFCVFMLYPLLRSLWLTVHKTVGPRQEYFVGLDNFRFMLQDQIFWLAVANTTAYAVGYIALQIPIALGLALLLNGNWIVGRSLFRFAFFSTHLVGGVFVAILFSQVLAKDFGLLNQTLSFVLSPFMDGPVAIAWLDNWSLTIVVLIMASLWLNAGWGMVYFLAALQAVDRELYEAAEVDGATPRQKFWHVTLPGIRPVLIFLTLTGLIGGFQIFELPFVLYNQTPGPLNSGLTLVMYLFNVGFGVGDLGLASAIGWALVFIVLLVSILQLSIARAGRSAT
jgi:ABC-type sugar transport system permease subunit